MLVSWTSGSILFAAGEERTLWYYWGTRDLPVWKGPQVAIPGPPMINGGAFVATAQGSRSVASEFEQAMQYLVTIKNLSAGAGKFSLYGGGLT